jgi:hypothetical protein
MFNYVVYYNQLVRKVWLFFDSLSITSYP